MIGNHIDIHVFFRFVEIKHDLLLSCNYSHSFIPFSRCVKDLSLER
jgi:hypothetical protein